MVMMLDHDMLTREVLGVWARNVDNPQAHVEVLARLAVDTVLDNLGMSMKPADGTLAGHHH